ncbi:DUF1684 domain-containing protein [Chloroflexi bacterium CFX5]|nr:DUF1684 domain-containing protein [Chloroflexi bacterium CFX5]
MDTYTQRIEQIRAERAQSFASDPLSWLNLVGLFWLEDGENNFGSSSEAKISLLQFPQPVCGHFLFKNGKVTVHPTVEMSMNGGGVGSRPLFTDKDAKPDLLEIGRLSIKIIVRGDATLVRVWDREAELKKGFTGFNYYPADPAYKVVAKYIRYEPPIPTIRVEGIGTEISTFFMGRAEFTINGVDCALEAEQSGDELLFNFKDGTNADTTYGGGRRFYLPPPEGDEIILDFNLTDNWPCAYTPFATCPIPPRQNVLKVRVEAGEKVFK